MDIRFKNLRSAVVKLTNRCNIRCKYCYENIIAKGTDMSSEVFRRMLQAMLSSTSAENFLLILHGGEPTILPADWFEENLSLARDMAELYSKRLDITIQSNLIDVSDDKLRVFRDLKVSMGGSLDNPAFLQGSLRPLADKAVATYFRAREMGVRVGILTTINCSNIEYMREFCIWLSDTLHVQHFKANVAYPVGAGLNIIVPTAQGIFAAQRSIVEFMLETNGGLVEDNLSWEIVRFFENHHGGRDRPGSLCDDKRCGAGSRVVGVTPDGSLLPCGRFAWSDGHHYLGTLAPVSESGKEFFESVDQLSFASWNFTSFAARIGVQLRCRASEFRNWW